MDLAILCIVLISEVNYFGKGKLARKKSSQLLVYITDCLQKTFAHDTDGFLTKERFEVVMQPLVDQVCIARFTGISVCFYIHASLQFSMIEYTNIIFYSG